MRYSNMDFTGRCLQECNDMDGRVIKNSCFSQEHPDTHVFPVGMKNVTFIHCNLDNVFIPSGNDVVECSQRRYMAQSDGFDWLVDGNNEPISRIE